MRLLRVVFWGLGLSGLFLLPGTAPAATSAPEPLLLEGDLFYFHHLNDPVNLRSGNLFLPARDLELPAERGLPLTFERGYNSFHAQRRYALGKGWISTADRQAGFIPERGVLFYLDASGAQTEFAPTAETVENWIALLLKSNPAPAEKDKLPELYRRDRQRLLRDLQRLTPGSKRAPAGQYETALGRRQTMTADQRGYQYQNAAGDTLLFDPEGRLRRENNRAGFALEYEYKDGRLVAVRDSFNRQLTLGWSKLGTISRISDPLGREVSYTYSPELYLTEVVLPGNRHFLYNYSKDGLLLRQTYPDQTFTENEYDSRDRAVAQRGPGKRTTRYQYHPDPEKAFCTVLQPDGSTVEYLHYRQDNRTAVNGPGHLRQEYRRNQRGLVVQEKRNDLTLNRYEFDQAGRLVKQEDALGRQTRIAYQEPCGAPQNIADGHGSTSYEYSSDCRQLTAITYPDGSRERFEYDAAGQLAARLGALGDTTRFWYNDQGLLAKVMGPRGGVTQFEHDRNGRVVATVSPTGERTSFAYDAADNPIRLTYPNRASETLAYDALGRLISTTGRLGEKTSYRYDPAGNLIEEIGPSGAKTVYEYDPADRLVAAHDPLKQTTRYAYDPAGRLVQAADPLGQINRYSYDAQDNLLSAKRHDGATYTFRYDAVGRLTRVIDPMGAETAYQYDDAKLLLTAINPLGGRRVLQFDSRERLTLLREEDGAEARFAYDAAGHLQQVQDPQGNTFQLAYDPDGNRIAVTDPLGASRGFTYDLAGRITARRDENGHTTRFTYAGGDQVAEIARADGSKLAFTYDAAGNLLSFTDARGHLTRFAYDSEGRLVRRTDPLGQVTSYAYDPAGRVIQAVLADGSRRELVYDAAGRLIKMISGKNLLWAASYDISGQARTLDDGSTRLEREYDRAGRLLRETERPGGGWVGYSYDPLGRRISRRDNRGQELRYRYDLAGRVSEIAEVKAAASTRFTYEAHGWRNAVYYPGGLEGHFRYDPAGRVEKIAYRRGDKELWSQQYRYDPAGNILSLVTPQGRAEYEYDQLHRLQRAALPAAGTFTYRYDPAGNLLEKVGPKGRSTFEYDAANRLLRSAGTNYRYDELGQLRAIDDGIDRREYFYDPAGRLTSLRYKGQETSYRYDPLGRLVEKRGANPRLFRYDQNNLAAVADPKAKRELSLVGGPELDDQLYARSADRLDLYLRDHLGSVIGVSDAQGETVREIAYDPYGLPLSPKGLPALAFSGLPYEPELGWYNARHRLYSPATARFTSPDPLGLAGGPNLYAYAEGNPVNFTDPLGLVITRSGQTRRTVSLNTAAGRGLPKEYQPSGKGGGINLTKIMIGLTLADVFIWLTGREISIGKSLEKAGENLLDRILNPTLAAEKAAGDNGGNPFLTSRQSNRSTTSAEALASGQQWLESQKYTVEGGVGWKLINNQGCRQYADALTRQTFTACDANYTPAMAQSYFDTLRLQDKGAAFGVNQGNPGFRTGTGAGNRGGLFGRLN